ncbi:MAG: hypothetical protein IJ009_00805 [Clostridia bacterium]|nr:hypothetical protein [Clostridia bacterium]
MRVAVCVDDLGGMIFNHRRQSRDRVLVADLLTEAGKGRLLISPFSADLLGEGGATVTPQFLSAAEKGDLCFVESEPLAPHLDRIDELIVYRWNCRYPRDLCLDVEPLAAGLRLSERTEFAGYSHKIITKERYIR